MDTDTRISRYLKDIEYNYEEIVALQVDASRRKYFRISHKNNSAILVDSSLEKTSLIDFHKMSLWLKSQGYSSPKIYNVNFKKGLSIMEDFGNNKFSSFFLNNKKNEYSIYLETIRLLLNLSKKKRPDFLRNFSKNVLFRELSIFLDWHNYYKREKKKNEISEWNLIWDNLFNIALKDKKKSVVLRDFHIDNLFLLKKRKGIKRIGLIDFQDALFGHPCYDLVSLLQDVRVNIPKRKEYKLLDAYLSYYTNSSEIFKQSYLILGTQRLLKIIGIFKRLEYLQKKKVYLNYLPRTWKLLNGNLKHPLFRDLNLWFKSYGN